MIRELNNQQFWCNLFSSGLIKLLKHVMNCLMSRISYLNINYFVYKYFRLLGLLWTECTNTSLAAINDLASVIDTRGPFYQHGLTLIPSQISNSVHNVWDENTYLFPNVNGAAVEIWEWISNFTSHFIMDIITYPCWDSSKFILVKGSLMSLTPEHQLLQNDGI